MSGFIAGFLHLEWATWVRPFTEGEWSRYFWLYWLSGLGMALHCQLLLGRGGYDYLIIPLYPLGFFVGWVKSDHSPRDFAYRRDGGDLHHLTVYGNYDGTNAFGEALPMLNDGLHWMYGLLCRAAYLLVLWVTYMPMWKAIHHFLTT